MAELSLLDTSVLDGDAALPRRREAEGDAARNLLRSIRRVCTAPESTVQTTPSPLTFPFVTETSPICTVSLPMLFVTDTPRPLPAGSSRRRERQLKL
jgi:hypothetical protein